MVKWDFSSPSESSYDPSDLGVLIADSRLDDTCPPTESLPRKDETLLKLPTLLDLDSDLDFSSPNEKTLCPDAEYRMPLCCSGVFDGKNAGLCVQCML
jgi:hypothetical protein